MIRQPGSCDRGMIDALLSGELSDTDERRLTDHLDRCADCRRSLEVRSADAAVWEETGLLLREGRFDADSCFEELQETENSLDPASPASLSIQYVLDSLGPTDRPDKLGRLGSYEIMGVVGAGGMGVVLKAFDCSLDRPVAIKVLAPHLASSGAARQRFAREAKAAAGVLHPNVVAIHGVSDAGDTSTLPYLVMPYVRGSSLQARLDQDGPLTLTETLRVAAQIVDGLAAAHAQGLVHRDIKPANILLEEGIERVSITDFGLARAVDDATLTHSGVIAGTPQYMSPEQARGEPIDARSDLFSLGSVIYAMCTGRPPFRAESTYGILRRITDDSPRPIRDLNSDVPFWLCRLVQKLHAKSPDDRYQSASSVAEVLHQCLAHVQTSEARLPKELRWAFDLRKLLRRSLIGAGAVAALVVVVMLARPQQPLTTGDEPIGIAASESPPVPQTETAWTDETQPSIETVQHWIDSLDAQTHHSFERGPENSPTDSQQPSNIRD